MACEGAYHRDRGGPWNSEEQAALPLRAADPNSWARRPRQWNLAAGWQAPEDSPGPARRGIRFPSQPSGNVPNHLSAVRPRVDHVARNPATLAKLPAKASAP